MMRSYRHVLLATAAGVAALAGSVLLPAAASAQPAGTPTTPTINLELNPATVDYGHQSVTASGTVTASGSPVVGAAVTVSYLDIDKQRAQISLTTGNDGSYSGTIADPKTAAQLVTASVAATSSTAMASTSAQLGFAVDAVTITGGFAQSSVNAGSTDTFSGVASYISGGSPHPLANSLLSVTFSTSGAENSGTVSTTVATAADGSFSYVTPEIKVAIDSAELTVNSAATPYLDAGQLSVTVPVNQAAQFDVFTGTISSDRVLQFSACAGIPEPLADAPLDGPVDFQYSAAKSGPWETLGTGKDDGNSSCGTYTGKFKAPLANAYYRAFAPAVPGQMAAASQVIHLWKYPTKITGFTITPRSVGRNGKVTVSGRLWALKKKRTPDARQRIIVEFRYHNKTYVLRHRLITDSAGRFRGTFRVPRTASWLALYQGGGNQFATTSNALTIKVR